MSDQYTVTSSQGWGSRIGNSIKGILIGGVMTIASFPILFSNEGRAVAREKALNEGAAAVVSVDAASIDAQNEGRLVHLSGNAQTTDVVQDPEFGAQTVALRLVREVTMYQWKEKEERETRKKMGGGEETVTTYKYTKDWDDDVIDSSSFYDSEGHKNPGVKPYNSESFQAENVTVGAFRMNPSQVARTGSPSDLPDDVALTLPTDLGPVKRVGNTAYFGQDSASPQIGDVRVSFFLVPPSDVSLVAEQRDGTMQPFTTPSGGEVDLLEDGIVSAAAMFQIAQDENTMLTWVLRGVGFFLMFLGLSLLFKPLSVLADVVPIFGSIVSVGTGVVAFLLAAAGSFLTIAIGWVFFRPLIGIPLVIVGVGALVWTFLKVKAAPRPASQGAVTA
ncbi:uncharacterized protein DUF1625 [Panacagrimonas perspica]|uniref:Uncharacterized protein DUF1625 n=1 Tax=Panacagrimonas perspica TaxID=381431 RepID=A0A4R7P5W2_9GAMM|nr:TMEM43 family protein [Panacagrimonas perspica]TDU28641.1 uncharacterized protein DUF1625 [Panacagrimonas perspica]THD04970.1 hypothetical protein B1810_03220 [Panacagrimonas perspica]